MRQSVVPRRLKIVALASVFYFLLVPIIPFQQYYSGNFWTQDARNEVCPTSQPWFEILGPHGSSAPLPSSAYVVFGTESISAFVFDFGLVNSDKCGFTALTTFSGNHPLLFPIELLSLLFLVIMFLLLKDYVLDPLKQEVEQTARHLK